MKTREYKFLRSVITLLLALSMVLGTPAAALAAADGTVDASKTTAVRDTNGDGVIQYVALGDSVTNGYGMVDYTYEDGTNVRGFRVQPEDSYPVIAAEAIEKMTGMTVELDQLALSGFRAEDLYFMLDNDFKADSYHLNYFGDGKNEGYFMEAVEGWMAHDEAAKKKYADSGLTYDQILRQEYQAAVASADLITINIGNNNFGTFMFNKLFDCLGVTDYNDETDFTLFMDEASAATIDTMLDTLAAELAGDNEKGQMVVKTIMQSLVYNYISYTHYFDAVLEKIYAANPDVQIIVMDMVNMMEDIHMVGDVFGEFGDLAPIYAMFVDMANLYTKELTPYASRLTHVDIYEEADETLHLFYDYYKDYPDSNYEGGLHPDAQRLLDGVFQEFIGVSNEDMAVILGLFTELTNLVNNIQSVVETELIDGAVVPAIVDGVQDVVDVVDSAVEGVAQAKAAVYAAVEGVAMIPTALEGVEQAQKLVDLVVEQVLGNEQLKQVFTGSKTSDMIKNAIIGEIEKTLADMDITQYGLADTEENRKLLAEEVYHIACIYYDEINYNNGTKESANRLCVIEVIRFQQIHVEGASEADSAATAQMAYEVAAAYNAEFSKSQDKKAATIAALASQLDGNLEQGALAYELNEIYLADGEDAAVEYALVSQVGEEDASLALQINAMVEAQGRDAVNLAVLQTQITDKALANALYAVYLHAIEDKAISDEDMKLACMYVLESIMTEEEAASVYACYEGGKDGIFYDPDVKTTVVVLLCLAEAYEDKAKASEDYDSYILYRLFPSNFNKLTKCTNIYMDTLLAREELDFLQPLTDFILNTADLEKPVRAEGETDEEYAARVEQYEYDSSINVMYIRFITLTGALVHPSDVGHAYLAEKLVASLDDIKAPGTDAAPKLSSSAKLLSLGDSLASSNGLDSDQLNYGELVAKAQNLAYTELSVDGLRLNDARFLLDDSYEGDAYTAELFGDEANKLKKQFRDTIADQDMILVNLGSMNLGYSIAQMAKYQSEKDTYAMTLADVEAMEDMNLGRRADVLLETFRNVMGVDAPDALNTLLLAFESYGYGYTLFADSLDETISEIRKLNEDAVIVLVGQYDLLGNAYYTDGDVKMDMGHMAWQASQRMNTYLNTYAQMNSNVVYVDVTGAENSQPKDGLNLANTEMLEKALINAHATAKGHSFIAEQIEKAISEMPEEPEVPEVPEESAVSRISGKTRYQTAFATANALKKTLGVEKFEAVVVASGEVFADALAGAYLAAQKDAPILLVDLYNMVDVKNYIRSNVVEEGTVYLLGGTAAVAATMESGLDDYKVKRLSGKTRYETNLKILEEAGVEGQEILVCTGHDFADSLSASAVNKPILLVNRTLTDAQKTFLESTSGEFIIIGGKAAVSETVEKELRSYGTIERLSGKTRYQTSVLVAEHFFDSPESIVLAYAYNFPDGLCGGPLAAKMYAPMILTATGEETAAAAYAKDTGIAKGVVLGGASLISDDAARKIFRLDADEAIVKQ